MLKTKLVHTIFIRKSFRVAKLLDVKEYHEGLDMIDVVERNTLEAEVTWSTSQPI